MERISVVGTEREIVDRAHSSISSNSTTVALASNSCRRDLARLPSEHHVEG